MSLARTLARTAPAIVCMALACTSHAETASGDLPDGMPVGDGFDGPEGAPLIELGGDVRAEGYLATTEFFDQQIVGGRVTVTNDSDAPAFYAFHAAVFDAEGHLLGAATMASFGEDGMAPGDSTQLGSLIIQMPPAELEKIRSWQVTFQVSDQPF